jgi:glyoxylase-like metal-dependent hydrolase (beta-lactamase superfamily II)
MKPHLVLGDITIHRVVEQEGGFFDVREFFPALTTEMLDENRSWLQPTYVSPDDKLMLCIQSYIVETPHHTILVDSCVGNHKPRPNRKMWDNLSSDRWEKNLAAAGFAVEDIDIVMCTHLHVDHVGWNTRLDNGRWVPTFPNARYLFSGVELAYWTERLATKPETCLWIEDSVLPIVHAKRAEEVKSEHALDDTVRLIPTPGHTIDHYSVVVGKAGQDALITGDMVHSPLQARYPELGMFSDYNSKQAGETRRRIFGCYCDTSTLLCTAHLPSPSTARVTAWGDGFKFIPVTE